MPKPTAEALRFAAEWLDAYDAGEDLDDAAEIASVAADLRARADRLDFETEVRTVAARVSRELGRPANDPAVLKGAREALRRVRSAS